MPFTLSHAIVAPPLAKYLRLPLAGVVIGTMSPDLVRMVSDYAPLAYLAHTWQGLLYPDLVLGLVFSALWYVIYRPVIYHYAQVQHDLALHTWWQRLRFVGLLIVGIVLGSMTHIVWDGLTHLDFRTFAFHHALAQSVSLFGHVYPLHFVLQIGCSIVALPFVFYAMFRYHQRHYCPHEYTLMDFVLLIGAILGLLLLNSTVAYGYYQHHRTLFQVDLYAFVGRAINLMSSYSLLLITLLCLLWLLYRQLSSRSM